MAYSLCSLLIVTIFCTTVYAAEQAPALSRADFLEEIIEGIRHGADPNERYLSLPPLFFAISRGNIDQCRALIKLGASVRPNMSVRPDILYGLRYYY